MLVSTLNPTAWFCEQCHNVSDDIFLFSVLGEGGVCFLPRPTWAFAADWDHSAGVIGYSKWGENGNMHKNT